MGADPKGMLLEAPRNEERFACLVPPSGLIVFQLYREQTNTYVGWGRCVGVWERATRNAQ